MKQLILCAIIASCVLAESGESLSKSDKKSKKSTPKTSRDYSNLETIDIGTSTIEAREFVPPYQSGEVVSRHLLENSPSGNGDITSILRLLPNVQYDAAQSVSLTPGEIDPANIQISGGLYYQNNFQFDGFNMNNDLDPNSGGGTNNQTSIKGGISQGMNIDTSLLESIVVMDSNISAKYGNFTGGVVDAKVRRPRRDRWHGNLSYQFTQGSAYPDDFSLTKYHLDYDTQTKKIGGTEISGAIRMLSSSDENYQPEFFKWSAKSSLEGYITDTVGLVASFVTTQSKMPLKSYRTTDTGTYNYGDDLDTKRDNTRKLYNYFVKMHWEALDSLSFEASAAYAPQYNTYYNDAAANSYYTMESGGIQAGLKAMWENSLGVWSAQVGYSALEHSRRSDASYFYQWQRTKTKNFGGTQSLVFEGGFGDTDQRQNKLSFKTDFDFHPIPVLNHFHTFSIGIDYKYFNIIRERLKDYRQIQGNPTATNYTAGRHSCGTDSLGFNELCYIDNRMTYNGRTGTFTEGALIMQWAKWIRIIRAGKHQIDGGEFGAYLEDDIKIPLGKHTLNIRPGVRFDKDDYMGKKTIAPRFAITYTTPAPREYRTQFTFGANRYYGRSLYNQWLYAQTAGGYEQYARALCNRTNSVTNGVSVASVNNAAFRGLMAKCDAQYQPSQWVKGKDYDFTSIFHFEQLRVPYDDEIAGGIKQNFGIFELSAKYISRKGRDEIMRKDVKNDYYWTNDGESKSRIISISVQNIKPLETFGISHHYLLAFDWTRINRSYNTQFNTHNGVDRDYDEYDTNPLIWYDGRAINYRDRPVENFMRPWTLRLTTTHSYDFGRAKLMWNNLFRYRAEYERMVGLLDSHPDYDAQWKQKCPDCTAYYARKTFNGAFTWDMRIGLEISDGVAGGLYINVDIFNVLNARNMTTVSGWNASTSGNYISPGISEPNVAQGVYDFPVYELGRQFWLQIGYRF